MKRRFSALLMLLAYTLYVFSGCSTRQSENGAETLFSCHEVLADNVVSDFCVFGNTLLVICVFDDIYKLKVIDLTSGSMDQVEIPFNENCQLVGAAENTLWILEAGKQLREYAWNGMLQSSFSCDAMHVVVDGNGIIYALGENIVVYNSAGNEISSVASPDMADIIPADAGALILDQSLYTLNLLQADGTVTLIKKLASDQFPVYYDVDEGLWLYDAGAFLHYSADGSQLIEQILMSDNSLGASTKVMRCDTGFAVLLNVTLYVISRDQLPDLADNEVGKTKLVLAAYEPDAKLRIHVAAYNDKSEKYYIELRNYAAQDRSIVDAMEQLYLDVAAGDVPDIYCFRNNGGYGLMPYVLQSKGALADIKSYLGNDDEFDDDVLLPNIVSALEVQGQLFELPVSYRINCVVGRKAEIEKLSDMSLEEYEKWISDCKTSPFGTTSAETILAWLVSYNIDCYADYENGTCNFDCASFRTLLDITKRLNNLETKEADNIELILQGEQVAEFANIGSFQMMQFYRKLFQSDELTFNGIPNAAGDSSSIQITMSFGISATTRHPKESWEFVRQFISSDYQDTQSGFPVTVAELNRRYENPAVYENECWEAGNLNVTISVQAPDQTDCVLVRTLMERTARIYNMDYVLMEIINGELAPFLNGSQSTDKTAFEIQQRASVYMSEQYG